MERTQIEVSISLSKKKSDVTFNQDQCHFLKVRQLIGFMPAS